MYSKIMIPVDLQHVDKIEKSLRAAAQLARLWSAEVCYVAVTGSVPNRVAKSPEEFAAELDMFAREQGAEYAVETSAHVVQSTDVAVELDDKLLAAIDEVGADLVVMASHVPGVPDHLHLLSSNAGWLARHASVAVFVVR